MKTVRIRTGEQNLSDSNLAKIKTTKVEFDPNSNGYIVTLDLTWNNRWITLTPKTGGGNDTTYTALTPITKSITGKLAYIPKKTVTNYDVFGLQLKFSFNCRDFGVASTSIGDNIDIECNMNFNNR
jgi:hypothetical protein